MELSIKYKPAQNGPNNKWSWVWNGNWIWSIVVVVMLDIKRAKKKKGQTGKESNKGGELGEC